MELREKVGTLPFSPGVYLYKDLHGRVIYVGKAKSLRNRVRSYFSEDKLSDVKTGTLISEARDIGYQRLRLDTVDPLMKDAIAMYRKIGFQEIAPYRANPIAGALYMELQL